MHFAPSPAYKRKQALSGLRRVGPESFGIFGIPIPNRYFLTPYDIWDDAVRIAKDSGKEHRYRGSDQSKSTHRLAVQSRSTIVGHFQAHSSRNSDCPSLTARSTFGRSLIQLGSWVLLRRELRYLLLSVQNFQLRNDVRYFHIAAKRRLNEPNPEERATSLLRSVNTPARFQKWMMVWVTACGGQRW